MESNLQIKFFLILLASVLFLPISIQFMKWIVKKADLYRLNFKGNRIPVGFGFIVAIIAVPLYILVSYLFGFPKISILFLLVILAFGILGLIDDIYGSRNTGGFRGHLSKLLKGKVTTGAVKAIGGGIISLILGYLLAGNIYAGILNGLLIALSANTLNLFDLRPGRSLFIFWLGLLMLLLISPTKLMAALLIPVIIPVVWLTYFDRNASIMIGDAGSNTIGAVLGMSYSFVLDEVWKIVLIILLALIHVYSEKNSITKLIEHNKILNRIDQLLGKR